MTTRASEAIVLGEDRAARRALARRLARQGIRTVLADHGPEPLADFLRRPGPLTLLLLDGPPPPPRPRQGPGVPTALDPLTLCCLSGAVALAYRPARRPAPPPPSGLRPAAPGGPGGAVHDPGRPPTRFGRRG